MHDASIRMYHVRLSKLEDAAMKAMTPEDYLMQVKNIDLRLSSLEGELRAAHRERDAEYAEKLTSIIQEDLERYKELKIRIRSEIQQLPDCRLGTLLMEYYVRGNTWDMVAEAIGIKDAKWVRTRLREKALKLFAAYYPKYFI